MIVVGETYYFVCHTYFHYVAVVVSIDGKHDVTTGRCVRIHSDTRDFTEFFATGITKDTNWTDCPDSSSLQWLNAHPWPHKIPEPKRSKK